RWEIGPTGAWRASTRRTSSIWPSPLAAASATALASSVSRARVTTICGSTTPEGRGNNGRVRCSAGSFTGPPGGPDGPGITRLQNRTTSSGRSFPRRATPPCRGSRAGQPSARGVVEGVDDLPQVVDGGVGRARDGHVGTEVRDTGVDERGDARHRPVQIDAPVVAPHRRQGAGDLDGVGVPVGSGDGFAHAWNAGREVLSIISPWDPTSTKASQPPRHSLVEPPAHPDRYPA